MGKDDDQAVVAQYQKSPKLQITNSKLQTIT